MSSDNVIKLIQPGIFTDHLTEILRDGACALLTQALDTKDGCPEATSTPLQR